jgi:hypothetical protein
MRSVREEGSRDNAVSNDGGGISMVHRCGLRPADGESEPNYWLGYSSGPKTDQQVSQLCNFILNFVLHRYVEDRWRLKKFDALALAGLKFLWDRL